MNQFTNIKIRNFVSVTCVLYYFNVLQRINLVMSTIQSSDFNRTSYHDIKMNSSNVSRPQEMVIFDLDFVLWPFFVDNDIRLNGTFPVMVKTDNDTVAPYPEAKGALELMVKKNFLIGLIGQVEKTQRAIDLLKSFDLYRFFQFIELGMEKKLTMIKRIQSKAGVDLNNILFIEYDNNQVVSDEVLDVLFEHVFLMYIDDNGLTKKYMEDALFVYFQRPKNTLKQKEELIKLYGIGNQNPNTTVRIETVRPQPTNRSANHKKSNQNH